MECIITVEVGTNAVRINAFEIDGKVIATAKGHYPTFHLGPDYSEQDPDQMFITILYVMKNFLKEKIHAKNYQVISICFSASMHSLLPVDKNGIPLGHAITWADNRGKHEARELKTSSLGEKLYDLTGTPIHPMSPLIKIAWMRRHQSDRFRQAAKFLSIKSYVLQQLTEGYLLDYSLASATGLLNIHKLAWEPDALAYAGITPDRLPELVPIYHSPGKLRKEYQTSLGLSDEVELIVGSSDGCLATVGAGIWDDKKASITIEDSGAVRVIGKEAIKDPKRRLFNYRLTDQYFVSGGPTNNGGVAFEWFAKQFGDFKHAFDIDYAMEQLVREASNVAVGSEGLLFLPYLHGERAPIWNANARGCYFGINVNHEKKHFVRATIEGILYEIYSIGKTLQEHCDFDRIVTNGSFASIPFCTQMLADIFDKTVSIGENPDSIAQGAYQLSAIKLGVFQNLDHAARSVVISETYKPQKSHHDIYQKYFSIFERLGNSLQGEFEELANLQ